MTLCTFRVSNVNSSGETFEVKEASNYIQVIKGPGLKTIGQDPGAEAKGSNYCIYPAKVTEDLDSSTNDPREMTIIQGLAGC